MRNRFLPHLAALAFLIPVFFLSCHPDHTGSGTVLSKADSAKIYLENLDKKIRDNPENPELYQERATFFLRDHQLDRALTDIRKALSLDPGKPDYYVTLSDILLISGQAQSCDEVLQKALALDGSSNKVLIRLAKLNLIMKDYHKTFMYLARAIKLNPQNPEAYYTRAVAFLENGDTLHGLGDLQKAVDQDQGYYDAYITLGELYSGKKNPMAADYFKNALKVRPDSKEALYMLGMFYQETEQYDKAIETYQRLNRVDTTFRAALYNIGYIYLVYLKNFPRAVECFTDAIKKDPGYFEAYYNRGFAYELMGKYDQAYADYRKTLKIQVNYSKAIEGLNRLDRLKR